MLYKLTPAAEDDLINIYAESFRSFGEVQAEKYFSELKNCFEILSENPLVSRERTEFEPSVRIHPHGSHLVVYVVRKDFVLIVRILHSRMDIQVHLLSSE